MRDRIRFDIESGRLARTGLAAWILVAGLSGGLAAQESVDRGVGPRIVSAAAEPCLNMRSRPSYRSLIVDCLAGGSRVTVSMVRDGWSYVTTSDDNSGWVGSRFLLAGSSDTPAASAAETVESPETDNDYPSRELELLRQAAQERERMAAEVRSRDEELAAVRSAWEAASAEASALNTRIQELTEERDSLGRQLARAEARILYLLSDLEETRAELMRLKGIPPKLVQPEPEPAPEPPAPVAEVEVEPQPEADSEPEAFPLPTGTSFVLLDEVVATVRAWAQAWSDQRVEDYLSFYAPSFKPADGQSREAWAANRRQRVAAPRSVEVTLDQIHPTVSGERASVSFVQTYASDSFGDQVSKTLVLERSDGGSWQIVEERVD